MERAQRDEYEMRQALTAIMLAVLLLGSGAVFASPAQAAAGFVGGDAGAPVGLMTGLLMIGFLVAQRLMGDDD